MNRSRVAGEHGSWKNGKEEVSGEASRGGRRLCKEQVAVLAASRTAVLVERLGQMGLLQEPGRGRGVEVCAQMMRKELKGQVQIPMKGAKGDSRSSRAWSRGFCQVYPNRCPTGSPHQVTPNSERGGFGKNHQSRSFKASRFHGPLPRPWGPSGNFVFVSLYSREGPPDYMIPGPSLLVRLIHHCTLRACCLAYSR